MSGVRKFISLFLGAALCCAVALFSACEDKGKSTLLRAPAAAQDFSYSESGQEDFAAITSRAESFAAAFAAAAYAADEKGENIAVSPVSVYMGLSLAAECADGETKEELLAALELSEEELRADFHYLYRSLSDAFDTGMVTVGNSVWVNEGTQVKDECLDTLAEKYFAYSYAADFETDNENANQAVRYFVKEQTHGLIDTEFRLPPETYFALINTLYLKDTWNLFGDDLARTEDALTFTAADGTTSLQRFLQGDYSVGAAYETDVFSSYYTATYRGYRLKFIVPKEGYTADDVFTAENIALVSGVSDYGGLDEESKTRVNTRCIFPEFHASYDGDVADILRQSFGVDALFDPDAADLSALIAPSAMDKGRAYCREVRHVTDLTVDRKGIEGAAVTVIPGAGASDPGDYTDVYRDFVVDRAFGFVLTDRYGTTLFSGVIRSV